jgi:PAS domain-containing protein
MTDPLLRLQALARWEENAGKAQSVDSELTSEATRTLLHELQVHQIELELQNEELRQSQLALDVVKARYFDLYELAPVGYVTVSKAGLILECNLCAASLLGVPRAGLIKKPFIHRIAQEDRDAWYLLRKRLETDHEHINVD